MDTVKVSINITASVPDESGVDTILALSQVVGSSLKNNGVMVVHDLSFEVEDV